MPSPIWFCPSITWFRHASWVVRHIQLHPGSQNDERKASRWSKTRGLIISACAPKLLASQRKHLTCFFAIITWEQTSLVVRWWSGRLSENEVNSPWGYSHYSVQFGALPRQKRKVTAVRTRSVPYMYAHCPLPKCINCYHNAKGTHCFHHWGLIRAVPELRTFRPSSGTFYAVVRTWGRKRSSLNSTQREWTSDELKTWHKHLSKITSTFYSYIKINVVESQFKGRKVSLATETSAFALFLCCVEFFFWVDFGDKTPWCFRSLFVYFIACLNLSQLNVSCLVQHSLKNALTWWTMVQKLEFGVVFRNLMF